MFTFSILLMILVFIDKIEAEEAARKKAISDLDGKFITLSAARVIYNPNI